MNISVCIPYGFTDNRRAIICAWVTARWWALHPDFEVVYGDSNRDPFSRSQARNEAATKATGDVLIFADADTFTTPDNVEQGLDMLKNGAPWVIGSGNYYSLDEPCSDRFLEQPPDIDVTGPLTYHWVMKNRSIAGIQFMFRDAFVGYDERFIDWGWEDNAFQVLMDRKNGNHWRTKGNLYHLHHEPGLKFEQPHIQHNERLYKEIARDHIQ